MATVLARMRCVPLLTGSVACGLLVALLLIAAGVPDDAVRPVLIAMPFVLAILTGVAKSSTR